MIQKFHHMLTRRIRDERGFTLVELLMVMVIIGVLAGLGFTGFNALQNRSAKAQADVYWRDLNSAAQMYRVEKGNFTDDLTELIGDGNFLDDSVEPWNGEMTEFEYHLSESLVCAKVGTQIAGPAEACADVDFKEVPTSTGDGTGGDDED